MVVSLPASVIEVLLVRCLSGRGARVWVLLKTTSKVQRSRDMIVDFVKPHSAAGEGIKVVLASAPGPRSPLTLIVPGFGVAAMCTRWFRAYALVVTDSRVLLVRRGKVRPGRPQSVDLERTIESIRVFE